MEIPGKVIEISDNKIKIELKDIKACRSCGLCGIGKKSLIEIEKPVYKKFNSNDDIIINVKSKSFLYIACLSYGIPVLVLFLGYFTGAVFAKVLSVSTELIRVLTGFLFVIIYYILLKFLIKGYKDYDIINVINKTDD
ncbi:SoxR reducing system RseC family protein [bacterium]